MSEDPNDHPNSPPPLPAALPPDVEQLFDFAGPAWAERLRSAHEAPSLGKLGPYQILGEVGRGGQGEVYKAVQPGTGRVIALKRVAGLGFSPGPGVLARFTREVEALARLSHPNVVSVLSLEVIDGHSILLMEYVDGLPIDRWCDERWAAGIDPLRTVLSAFIGVCAGVAHAHQRGVIHRDIKPRNILVDREGRPRVLDFGIARLQRENALAAAGQAWTLTGFAGTPAYASPEQLRPGPDGVDTRTDVYSLGVLLFRVLTGQEAFTTAAGIAALIENAGRGISRTPSKVRAGLPSECDWIIRKAADPDPARRYQSVDALADDIERLLAGKAVLAHPPSAWYSLRRTVQRRPWTSAALAAGVLAVLTLGSVSAVQAVRLSARATALTAAVNETTTQRDRAERSEARLKTLNSRLMQAAMGAVNNETYFLSDDVPPLQTLQSLVDGLRPDDDPDSAAEMRMRLGFALYKAKRYKEAEEQLAAAQQISDRLDGPASQRAVWIALERSRALHHLNRLEDRLRELDRAVTRAAQSERTIYVAALHWSRMLALEALGRPTPEIRASASEAIARCDEHADRASERARCREEWAGILYNRGEYAAAERVLRDAMDVARTKRVDAQSMSRFRYAVAFNLVALGRLNEALPFAHDAAEYRLRSEGAETFRSHRYARFEAELLLNLGRHAQAVPRFHQALVRPTSTARPDARLTATLRFHLAVAHYGAGETDAARVELARAISSGKIPRPDAPEVAPALERIQAALRAAAWKIDASVEAALGDQAWIAQPMELFIEPTRGENDE